MQQIRDRLHWDDVADWIPVIEPHTWRGDEIVRAMQLIVRDRLSYTEAGRKLNCGDGTVKKLVTHGCSLVLLAMLGRLPLPYVEPPPLGQHRPPFSGDE